MTLLSQSNCDCPIAGYCNRHKISKSLHWWNLCQSNASYFDAWDQGRGPGQHQQRSNEAQAKRHAAQQTRVEASRELWAELHTQRNPTKAWFAAWLRKVPQYGCSCRRDFEEILKANPVRYDDWFAWSVEVHGLVSGKLGKPVMSLAEASTVWGVGGSEPIACQAGRYHGRTAHFL